MDSFCVLLYRLFDFSNSPFGLASSHQLGRARVVCVFGFVPRELLGEVSRTKFWKMEKDTHDALYSLCNFSPPSLLLYSFQILVLALIFLV